jgi:hypothetical protein
LKHGSSLHWCQNGDLQHHLDFRDGCKSIDYSNLDWDY